MVSLFIGSIIACTPLQACCSSYTNISWFGRTPFCTPVLGSKVRYFITCLFIAHLSPIFRFLFSLLKNIRSRDLLLDSKYCLSWIMNSTIFSPDLFICTVILLWLVELTDWLTKVVSGIFKRKLLIFSSKFEILNLMNSSHHIKLWKYGVYDKQ